MNQNETIECKCIKICSQYIGGIWSKVTDADVELKYFTKATYKTVLSVSLKSDILAINDEPRKALIHFYGVKTGARAIACRDEVYIAINMINFHLYGLAPRLYGVFSEGRIEQFIESRMANGEDFQCSEIVKSLTRQLARIHSLEMPYSKNANYIDHYSKMFVGVKLNFNLDNCSLKMQNLINTIVKFPFDEEMHWILPNCHQSGSPVVFSHNDVYFSNMLYRQDSSNGEKTREPIMLLDYDASTYNYRAFDLGYFLTLGTFQIVSRESVPLIELTNHTKSERFRRDFLKSYLIESERIKRETSNLIAINDKSIEKLEIEITSFLLYTMLTFIGWFRYKMSALKEINDSSMRAAENLNKILDQYREAKENFVKREMTRKTQFLK